MNLIKLFFGLFASLWGLIFLFIGGCIALAIVTFVMACFGGVDWDYSEGSRVGKLYKISKKGIIWKAYDGELDLELMESDTEGGMATKIWYFSVPDEDIAKRLEGVQGQRVKLEYKQKLIADFSKGTSSYHVYDFEVIE